MLINYKIAHSALKLGRFLSYKIGDMSFTGFVYYVDKGTIYDKYFRFEPDVYQKVHFRIPHRTSFGRYNPLNNPYANNFAELYDKLIE